MVVNKCWPTLQLLCRWWQNARLGASLKRVNSYIEREKQQSSCHYMKNEKTNVLSNGSTTDISQSHLSCASTTPCWPIQKYRFKHQRCTKTSPILGSNCFPFELGTGILTKLTTAKGNLILFFMIANDLSQLFAFQKPQNWPPREDIFVRSDRGDCPTHCHPAKITILTDLLPGEP